jgi:hypothetical protein
MDLEADAVSSENIDDVLASVEQHRDELEDAIRQVVQVLQAALSDEAPRRPAPVWKPAHSQPPTPEPKDA